MTSKKELIYELIGANEDRQERLYNDWWRRDTLTPWEKTWEYEIHEFIGKRIVELRAELEEIENEEV